MKSANYFLLTTSVLTAKEYLTAIRPGGSVDDELKVVETLARAAISELSIFWLNFRALSIATLESSVSFA